MTKKIGAKTLLWNCTQNWMYTLLSTHYTLFYSLKLQLWTSDWKKEQY